LHVSANALLQMAKRLGSTITSTGNAASLLDLLTCSLKHCGDRHSKYWHDSRSSWMLKQCRLIW